MIRDKQLSELMEELGDARRELKSATRDKGRYDEYATESSRNREVERYDKAQREVWRLEREVKAREDELRAEAEKRRKAVDARSQAGVDATKRIGDLIERRLGTLEKLVEELRAEVNLLRGNDRLSKKATSRGTIEYVDANRPFGFIAGPTGARIYFRRSATDGTESLVKNDIVEFELVNGDRGSEARNVTKLTVSR